MADGQKESGSALQKATLVLDVLLESTHPESLADISAKLDLPRQTVHRVVRQLEELDLVRRDFARDHYYVGSRMISLSINALQSAARLAPIHSVLKQLVADIGETCNIGVLERDEIVYIDRVECDWPLRLQLSAGSRVPKHATAIGKLLLAHLPSRTRKRILEAAPLASLTDNTITDPARLEEELKRIRRDGFASDGEENLAGLIGLAVPIHDGDGRVIAGLALHAPAARMSLEAAEEELPQLRSAAAKMQREIQNLQNDGRDEEFGTTKSDASAAD
ncbi:MAG: IclR family transcriptional regulator [Rhodospirillaceae bacterium]|nr:IclR family transcriptional regulator [Rhodospirillaceae bacterium]